MKVSNMNGIDISRYQPNIDLSKVPCDFVIIKATQGQSFVSNCFVGQIEQALSLGKKVGIYHYTDGCGVEAEANHFANTVKPYLGRAILVLDWENGSNAKFGDCNYAISLLNRIKELTGITPFIYMSKSYLRQWSDSWTAISAVNPLWCAQYANNNPTEYKDNPWTDSKGFGPWGDSCAILQYSSHGTLDGYNGNLDLDKAYITPEQWDAYAGIVESNPVPAKKSNEEIAREVLAGVWGNGDDRKNRLVAAGYNYDDIQNIVNSICNPAPVKKSNEEIAKEVLAGVWGNGNERKSCIENAGYNYSEIQNIVNSLCGKPKVVKKVTAKNGLWIHSSADTNKSTRTISIPHGTACTVLESSASMTKISCNYNGTHTGWVSTSYLG